jgi:HAE1 family hydrophobic/amphiphilic exporter-1
VGGWIHKLNALYMRLLTYFTYHLKAGMLVSVGLVAVFALTLLTTKMVLLPDMDQGQVSISISMPIGSEMEESAAIADRVSAIAREECPSWRTCTTSPRRSVTMMLNLVSKSERSRSSMDIANDLIPALRTSPAARSQSAPPAPWAWSAATTSTWKSQEMTTTP